MLRTHSLLSAGLMAWLVYQPSQAADLLQVYRQAYANDTQIRAAAADLQASQETIPQARALLLPNLNATGQQNRNFGVSSSPIQRNTEFDSYNYSVGVTQPLFNQGNFVRQRLAKSTVEQADANFAAAEQELILRTAQRYFDVLTALDTLNAVIANKNATAQQLEQANRRFEVGLITITDVYEAQARFDLSVANEIVARNDLADRLESLRQLTNQYHDELSELDQKAPFKPPTPADPEAWVQLALEHNPRIHGAAFGTETARENVNLQKAGHYPSLDLQANYTDQDSGEISQSGSQIGLQLNIPLYLGGAVVSRTREAAYQYESAKENLEGVQRDTIRQVRDSYRGVLAAISRIKALEQARISNKSSLEATQAGFDVGTRTIVDVLDQQRFLYEAERNYSVERYIYIISFLSLKQAAGQLKEGDLKAVNDWLIKPKPGQFAMLPKAK